MNLSFIFSLLVCSSNFVCFVTATYCKPVKWEPKFVKSR